VTVHVTPSGSRGARIPNVPAWLWRVLNAIGEIVFRVFGKRMRVAGRPVLLLETVGARSGARRRTILCWFPYRESSWIIVASRAGDARHPGWFHNLARNPERVWITFPGGTRLKVRPESLRGTERDQEWREVVKVSPQYAKYEDATDRVIPLIRLVREG
jgi:deazaflavin-dependent oxidoreductase (nitroreductase family)